MQKKTVTTSSTTLYALISGDANYATIVQEATRNGLEMSVVIYNGHGTENIYIEVGGPAATATHHPIKPDKSYSLVESDLTKITLIAGASNDSVFITISK